MRADWGSFLSDLTRHLKKEVVFRYKGYAKRQRVLASLWKGKFLRSQITFYSALYAKKRLRIKDYSFLLDLCAGIETIHLASLIHDDIMDNADERRGMKAFYKTFGVAEAIVYGDLLFNKGVSLFERQGLQAVALDAIEAICIGQQMELALSHKDALAFSDYMKLIGRKTAALFRCGPLSVERRMGPINKARLSEGAYHFGIAYQLYDDILDWSDDMSADLFSYPVFLYKKAFGRMPKRQIPKGERALVIRHARKEITRHLKKAAALNPNLAGMCAWLGKNMEVWDD